MFDNNIFWQLNLWGIVGIILGFFSLIISILNLNKSKAKVIISKLDLIIKDPVQITEWYGHKTKERMKDHILDFDLQITLKNIGGNSTAIEKPNLNFIIPLNSKGEYKIIKIAPFKSYAEPADIDNKEAWANQSLKQETSWEIRNGQVINDEIKYIIEDINDLCDIVDNYQTLAYSIDFTDSLGKKYNKNIDSVFIAS